MLIQTVDRIILICKQFVFQILFAPDMLLQQMPRKCDVIMPYFHSSIHSRIAPSYDMIHDLNSLIVYNINLRCNSLLIPTLTLRSSSGKDCTRQISLSRDSLKYRDSDSE
eukprot:989596_1